MWPWELCELIRDALDEHLDGPDGMCAESSTLLAYRLRRDGYDARVFTSKYSYRHRTLGLVSEDHAHVRLGDLVLDPTRQQFEDAPLTTTVDDPAYGPFELWEPDVRPPAQPDAYAAQSFMLRWQAAGDPWVLHRLRLVCADAGCPEVLPLPGRVPVVA